MACPMTEKAVKENGLTKKQVVTFCNKGCSVDCEKFFNEYIEKLRKKKLNNSAYTATEEKKTYYCKQSQCPIHACFSNDCQIEYVKESGPQVIAEFAAVIKRYCPHKNIFNCILEEILERKRYPHAAKSGEEYLERLKLKGQNSGCRLHNKRYRKDVE